MRAPLMLSLYAVLVLAQQSTAQVVHEPQWRLSPVALAAGDWHGHAVAVDGSWAVITQLNAGTATVYEWAQCRWNRRQTLTPSDTPGMAGFGSAAAIDGDVMLIGFDNDPIIAGTYRGPDVGSVYAYRRIGTTWVEEQELATSLLSVSARFGACIALQGNVAAIGAPAESVNSLADGAVYLFRHDGSQWNQQEQMGAPGGNAFDGLGTSVAMDGNFVVSGAPGKDDIASNAGVAWVFRFTQTSWSAHQKLLSAGAGAGDLQGVAVAMRGTTILVGAPGHDAGPVDTGLVRVFEQDPVNQLFWEQPALDTAHLSAGDQAGSALSVSGTRLAVGTPGRAAGQGAVHLHHDSGGTWDLDLEIAAGDGAAGDGLGNALALDDDVLFAGAIGADRAGIGTDSGAAYVHRANRLAFQVLPPVAGALMNLEMTASKGAPGTLLALVLTDFSGTSQFMPLRFGWFDASGNWTYQVTAPILFAASADMVVLGVSLEDGKLEMSHPARVYFP